VAGFDSRGGSIVFMRRKNTLAGDAGRPAGANRNLTRTGHLPNLLAPWLDSSPGCRLRFFWQGRKDLPGGSIPRSTNPAAPRRMILLLLIRFPSLIIAKRTEKSVRPAAGSARASFSALQFNASLRKISPLRRRDSLLSFRRSSSSLRFSRAAPAPALLLSPEFFLVA
jgi:hypothetical protein